MSNINLGIVYESHPAELSELEMSVAEISGEVPQKEKLFNYAGPNEVVQLIIDAFTWEKTLLGLALVFGAKFAGSFATELGKLTAAEVWKKKENFYAAIKQITTGPFVRLLNAIHKLQAKEQTVTIVIKIPGTPRNAGLELKSNDPAILAWQISNVIRCAEQIKKIVSETLENNQNKGLAQGKNPDMSIVVEVLENGDVKVFDIIIES